jgi:calcineurin-like phosphoesterase family protein
MGIIELPRIWFTSDQHFGHANIIEYCNRPYTDVDAMDAHLVDCWNSAIAPNETVYHLGDLTLGVDVVARRYFRQLNGKILVLGNALHHDKRWLPIWNMLGVGPYAKVGASSFFSASSLKVGILPPLYTLEFYELGTGMYPLAVTLCHYPLAVWDRKHYGAWHLYGHSHGQHKNGGLSFDVGVDANSYAPVLLSEVVDQMIARGWELPGGEL